MQEQHTQPDTPDVPHQPAMLTVDAVAMLLVCSPRTVYRLVDAGRIPPPYRLGGLSRWNPAVIETWINQGCQPCRKPSGR